MDAAMIARVMSVVPERAAWAHSGTAFAAHENQGAQVLCLAKFLGWMSPLTVLTKDDQRALGLLATHHRPVEEDLDLDSGAFEDGVEEDVAAGGEVLRPGVLDLVVADAALAGDEHHGGRGDAREVDGVMAGAADDVAVTEA
jgi:hypothetical protein